MCSWNKQFPNVIGIGPQWATANVRQKATVVCEVRGSQSTKRLMYEPRDLEHNIALRYGRQTQVKKKQRIDSRLTSLSSATTYADNVALPACTPSAVHRAATDKNLPAGPQQQSLSMWSMLGQTDRRTDARQMHRPRSACGSTTNWPHVRNGSTQT